jgi:SAM-dependent methyltransferase
VWPTDQNREAWERRFNPPMPPARLPDGVRERLGDVAGKHVLHLPAGTGGVTAQLIELGALVTGIDPSEQSLAAAREQVPDAAFFQAELHDIPLQLRRRRFSVVFAGEGTLALSPDLGAFLSTAAAALKKGGELVLCDLHPVAGCVEPVGLRWRESYFEEGRRRAGEIVTEVLRSELVVQEVAELPPAAKEQGDPRIPTWLLIRARKP